MLRLSLLYQDSDHIVGVDEANALLHVTWLRQPSSPAFREHTSRLLSIAREKGLQRALFDIRKRSYVSLSDQNWLLQELVPNTGRQPTRIAYLSTLQGLALMDTYRIQEAVDSLCGESQALQVSLFLSEAHAREWLMGLPVTGD